MGRKRILVAIGLALTSALSLAQSWSEAYEQGLAATRSGDWMVAREAFLNAAAMRPEDQSTATELPGSILDKRTWRNGSPYSPNFAAAYSAYRAALAEPDDTSRRGMLQTAAMEMGTLLDKEQRSAETYFVLNQIYTVLQDAAMQREVENRYRDVGTNGWRVDSVFMTPEELAAIRAMTGQPANTNPTEPTGNNTGNVITIPPTIPTPAQPGGPASRVPTLETKYALIIGNSMAQMESAKMEFAQNDAVLMRDTLVQHAGYADSNVSIVLNGTVDQIKAAATELAERMPEDGTLFFFFAGSGYSVDGRDYLAGVEATTSTHSAAMVSKVDLLMPFIRKGTSIYCFFEVNRTMNNGFSFGGEIPLTGRIAQMNGVIPNGKITSLYQGGNVYGVFAQAMARVIEDFRTNTIPLEEFGWMVFRQMQGGNQVPTLPAVRNIRPDQQKF